MKNRKGTKDTAQWLRSQLDALPQPELPPSLSAESLFARLDAMEAAGLLKDEEWTPAVLCAFTGAASAPVSRWKTWRPVLSAAAVFLLVAVVYWQGIQPTLRGAGSAAPQGDAGGYSTFSSGAEPEAALEKAMPEAAMDMAMDAPPDEGSAVPEEGQADPTAGGAGNRVSAQAMAPDYGDALQNVVLTVDLAEDGQNAEAFQSLYAAPAQLYKEADLVVTATVSPGLCEFWLLPETQAEISVESTLKGEPARLAGTLTIAYLGGVTTVEESIAHSPLSREEAVAKLQREYGLTRDQIGSGYVYVNVGRRVWLEQGREYVLFLLKDEKGYRLINSQYAVLTVSESGEIADGEGGLYGTVAQPKLG